MHRNYEMLTRLFGGDNVICYSVARPTLKSSFYLYYAWGVMVFLKETKKL